MEKKEKLKISDLFYDNRFLLVFSLLAAVVIWLVVAVVLAPEKTVTVKNVPVTIDYAKIEQSLSLIHI